MDRQKSILTKLSVLDPHFLRVINTSILHKGHVGNQNNDGESHFVITISSKYLAHLSMIKQHYLIKNLLREEFNNGLHSLSINIQK